MKPAETNVERETLSKAENGPFSSLFFPQSHLLLLFSSQHARHCLQPRAHSQLNYREGDQSRESLNLRAFLLANGFCFQDGSSCWTCLEIEEAELVMLMLVA